ncbi:phosphate ABC transporter permease subunit PstC [Methylophaga sp. OBS4]|uniref:phosphate ABC transporter permease subunit PstC n=1 Tax=Methylophaga sp. OBS4 TaxID=2991935 RepID=UPI00224DE539|nr:phosphate ABC transporter permease subunit PstC [Methylophaga sp. OBS4]MCX4186516.1 phosphate ABC transporter permease subunit PstC [Methylophaga sp. OBS4]
MFQLRSDQLASIILRFAALLCAAVLLAIIAVLLKESAPVLSEGGWQKFFIDTGWYPLEGLFGMLPMLLASLAVMGLAIVLAAPLGIACAIFVAFVAPDFLRKPYRFLIALLAGMPSVVLGLWGLMALVPVIASWQPPGTSLLVAGFVLSLMILPTVSLTTLAAFESLPNSLQQGAAAMGIRQSSQILKILMPAASASIAGGILLAVARALGETMVVLMVAGNVVQYPTGLFQPVRTLTANIALEMAYATDLHRAALFFSGLLLTALVLIIAYGAARLQRGAHHV